MGEKAPPPSPSYSYHHEINHPKHKSFTSFIYPDGRFGRGSRRLAPGWLVAGETNSGFRESAHKSKYLGGLAAFVRQQNSRWHRRIWCLQVRRSLWISGPSECGGRRGERPFSRPLS